MSKGLGFLLGGIVCILSGLNLWKTGWDFRNNLPVPHFVGILWMIFGVFLIIYGIKMILNREKTPTEYLICPACQNVVEVRQTPDKKCPKCGADLEVLKGFYQRHPELKKSPRVPPSI
jgi:hypothetical protein